MHSSLIIWLAMCSSSAFAFSPKQTRPIKTTGVMMVQPPSSVEHVELKQATAQSPSPTSLSMTTGFELPDLRNLLGASESSPLILGTNKQNFLKSLDTLSMLNQASRERTELLNNMISEKIVTNDLIIPSTSSKDDIIPTASLENPGLESTFSSVAPGTWKVVYAPHITTIAGLAGGKFDVQYTLFEDGTMTSHARYNFPVVGEGYLSVSGTYGSVDNTVSRVDFDRAWIKPLSGKNSVQIDEPYERLEDVPASSVKNIINNLGNAVFVDAFAIFPVSFLDEDTIVFDFELLGTRICAKRL